MLMPHKFWLSRHVNSEPGMRSNHSHSAVNAHVAQARGGKGAVLAHGLGLGCEPHGHSELADGERIISLVHRER
jgi:hypothetical protein